MQRSMKITSLIVPVLLLSACLETGSGGSTPPPPPPAPPGWQTEEHVDLSDSELVTNPRIFVDDVGNGFVFWLQWTGSDNRLLAGRYNTVDGWLGTGAIAMDGATIFHLDAAFDSNGNALATWVARESDAMVPPNYTWTVRARYYDAATDTWDVDTAILDTTTTGALLAPKVDFSPDGNAMVLWEAQVIPYQSGIASGFIGRIDSAFYNASAEPGSRWGASVPVSDDNTRDAAGTSFGFDSNGNAIAVWRKDSVDPALFQDMGNNWHVWASRYTPQTGWGPASHLEDNPVFGSESGIFRAEVAVDGAGNALAVWAQWDEATPTSSIWYNRYNAGAGWGTATLLENNSGDINSVDLAMNDDGTAAVVWRQSVTGMSGSHVWARIFETDSGWQTAAEVHGFTDGVSVNTPRATVAANGDIFSVWSVHPGDVWSIHANRYDSINGWGNAQAIETLGERAIDPDIVADPGGNAAAVWRQYDASNITHVWGNLYLAQ